MLVKKINCLVIEYKVIKERVTLKVNNIIDKVIAYVESTEYGRKLKNNVNKMIKGLGVALIYILSSMPFKVFAESTGDLAQVGSKFRQIFTPIIELLASLGYPTAYVMLIVGGLMVITGRKAKGLEIIKWAGVGYIALQVVPFLLNVLEMIGTALRSSI